MLDRITSLQVFVKVADLGSLSGAARALGMSQTMASKHMAALEARLQVPLLTRSTRQMRLTDAGQVFLVQSRNILAQLDEAESQVAARRERVTGRLRISLPVSYGLRKVVPVLTGFMQSHPELEVDLSLTDRRVDLLKEGVDLAIRITKMTDTSLMARRLAACPLVVVAAPSYLARHGRPTRVSELEQHTCLGYTLGRQDAGVWQFGGPEARPVVVKPRFRADNGDALLVAAIAGVGLAYQPLFLAEEAIAEGALEVLELDQPAAEMDGVFAVYPATRHPEAKFRAVIDYLVEALR